MVMVMVMIMVMVMVMAGHRPWVTVTPGFICKEFACVCTGRYGVNNRCKAGHIILSTYLHRERWSTSTYSKHLLVRDQWTTCIHNMYIRSQSTYDQLCWAHVDYILTLWLVVVTRRRRWITCYYDDSASRVVILCSSTTLTSTIKYYLAFFSQASS